MRRQGRLRDVFPTQAERWFWTLMFDEQYEGKITHAQLAYGTPQALANLVRAKTATPRGARRDL